MSNSPSAEPTAQLLALADAPVQLTEFNLRGELTTLGRASDCHIVVKRPLVSRLHASIERRGPRYVLSDLGSANGTYVNGRRLLEPYILCDDDLIGLGGPAPLLRFLDPDPTVQSAGLLRYDERTMSFSLSGTTVRLTPMQFRLLCHLYQHGNDVCSRESCAQAIWGRDYDSEVDARALDQAINSLRVALRQADPQADPIQTRRGLGFVLVL
jgi:DNA-binding response OmpR family regulator